MKRLLLILLMSISSLQSEDVDVTQPLRIHQLIPRDQYAFDLGVDPFLPQNFICLQNPKGICPEWLYWGPEEDLKAFFEDPRSLKVPIIRARLCAQITQQIVETAIKASNRKELESKLKCSIISKTWGCYPLFAIALTHEREYAAYVGLNYENYALQLHLIIPAGEDKAALNLWNNFLNRTKQLPDPLLFKAQGQEMHTGYTIVNTVNRSTKVTVERRKSDQKIRVAMVPVDEGVQFHLQTVAETKMGSKWHYGEPMLKISGTYIVDKGYVHLPMVTSVLIAEVEEFSSLPEKDAILVQEFHKRNLFRI